MALDGAVWLSRERGVLLTNSSPALSIRATHPRNALANGIGCYSGAARGCYTAYRNTPKTKPHFPIRKVEPTNETEHREKRTADTSLRHTKHNPISNRAGLAVVVF